MLEGRTETKQGDRTEYVGIAKVRFESTSTSNMDSIALTAVKSAEDCELVLSKPHDYSRTRLVCAQHYEGAERDSHQHWVMTLDKRGWL